MSSRRPAPPPIGDDNPPARPAARPAPPQGPTRDGGVVERMLAEEAAASTRLDGDTVDVGPVTVGHGGNGKGEMVDFMSQLPPTDTDAIMQRLIELRTKQPDPMSDYVGVGIRFVKFIAAAIAHEADMTGRTQQEVVRDALLGERPLSRDLLRAHFRALTGRDLDE